MNLGIAVFAYNRSQHLRRVLDGLKKNAGISKLYIFQDGLKSEEHRIEWERTNRVINDIDWCDVVYNQSSCNKGLAKSIIDGVTAVFMENDAAIILEDDCVPTANFISFMQQCFEKYQDDKRVYSVSGYSWPVDLPEDQFDVYGCGRISSWGWGTWKDRWEQYSVDNSILKRLKIDENKSRSLATWGSDLESIVIGNVAGRSNSWAVYWALHVIENDGICISPYRSLIQNIGVDGSGVHCGITNRFQSKMSEELKAEFSLPDKIDILRATKSEFASLYGSYTAINLYDEIRENVLIYGLGNFYFQYEKELNEVFNIKAFIDRSKRGWYAGKKIIGLHEIPLFNYDSVIIMVQDIHECMHIAKELINSGITAEHIVLGHNLYGRYSKSIDNIAVLPDGRLLLSFGNISIKVGSKDEFNNVCEVFINQVYNYSVNNGRKDIVIDIGMNIGDAALYFASQNNIAKVYGYEPFKETFLMAEENLIDKLNVGKVEIFNFGISNENATRVIGFNSDMSCGQSTLSDVREKAYETYIGWGLIEANHEQREQINVKKASEVFEPVIEAHPNHNFILKMDCEGEEYGIMEELLHSGTLMKFNFIMLEWHYQGKEILLDYLNEAGFSYWCNDKNKDMGLIYAYRGK